MGAETKVVAITGAGSGIGRSLACAYHARGFSLALSDIDEKGLHETAALCGGSAPDSRVDIVKVDVAKRAEVEAWSKSVLQRFGRVDVLINNAGVSLLSPAHEASLEDFEWLFQINFWGVVYGTNAFLPQMLARKQGAIVNISSIFGIVGYPNNGTYCASKFAVRGYTETLRHDLEGSGVLVTCVHPGGIKTNIVSNGRWRNDPGFSTSQHDAKRQFEKVARTTPDEAAATIIDGVDAQQVRILIGADARFLDIVQRMFPASYGKIFAFFLRRLGFTQSDK
jgi:NADP-dependent 3-hydroxy acid dehydrogenase YdfG